MPTRRQRPHPEIINSTIRIKLTPAERQEHDEIQMQLAAIPPEARGPGAAALARAMLDAVAQTKAPILEELVRRCKPHEPTLILSGSAKEHLAAVHACRSFGQAPLELQHSNVPAPHTLRAWANGGGTLAAVADDLAPEHHLRSVRNVIFFGRQTNRAAHLTTLALLGMQSGATAIQVTHIIAQDSVDEIIARRVMSMHQQETPPAGRTRLWMKHPG